MRVIFCVALFLVGMWVGQLKKDTIIVTRTERVQYLDFTAPDLMHRLEVCANTLNLTLREKPSIDKLHNKWLSSYKEGYRDARPR